MSSNLIGLTACALSVACSANALAAGCAKMSVQADGKSAAAQCAPIFPNLLNKYKIRPPWHAAGVDYCVGYATDLVLKDPLSLKIEGVEVDQRRKMVLIRQSDVTLDGYDFSLHGGYAVVVVRSARARITNSKFVVGPNQSAIPVQSDQESPDLYLSHNVIDGGGAHGARGDPSTIWSLVQLQGSNITMEYNWLRNSPQHIVEISNGRLIYRYNLIETVGFYDGAHPNGTQFNGGVHEHSQILFNTFYAQQPSGRFPLGLGEAIQVSAQLGSTIRDTEVGYNTVIAEGGPRKTASYTIAFHQDRPIRGPNLNNGGCVHHNYIDASGAYGPFYPKSGGAENIGYFDNVNMWLGLNFINSP